MKLYFVTELEVFAISLAGILFLHPLGMKLTHSFLLKNLSKLFITVVIDILSHGKRNLNKHLKSKVGVTASQF